MLPKSKSISSLSMPNSYYEKRETQKALYQLLKIVATSEDDSKRKNAEDAMVLTIDQLNLKHRLAAHHQRYYDAAILVTQEDVRKNIGKFFFKKNINILEISDRDDAQLAQLEKWFISWVLIILKRDCIDEHRKRKTKKVSLKSYIRNSQGEIIGTPEQIYGEDIEGNKAGAIGKGTRSLNAIDSLIAKEQAKQKPLAQWAKEYREKDSDNKLKNAHPRGQKECNCQVLLQLYEELSTMDEVYERLKHTGCTLGTIRNWLTKHKGEKSQNRPSCIKLMQQIIQEEYYR